MTQNQKLYELYKTSLTYQLWPIPQEKFNKIISGSDEANVETTVITMLSDDILEGFVVAKIKNHLGVISLILVAKECQRQGIGSKLLAEALLWLKKKGATEITIGAGAGGYFWPGIPQNLNCTNFFEKCGFKISEDGPVDMCQDVTNFVTPGGTFERMIEQSIQISFANSKWAQKILSFVAENFPNWLEYYEKEVKAKNFKKIFLAYHGEEVIAVSQLWRDDCTWRELFENSVGGGAALGVSKAWQGKGVGSAMKAWGTEKIRDSKRKYVYIGWTYEIEFYERLGFKIWRYYDNAKLWV